MGVDAKGTKKKAKRRRRLMRGEGRRHKVGVEWFFCQCVPDSSPTGGRLDSNIVCACGTGRKRNTSACFSPALKITTKEEEEATPGACSLTGGWNLQSKVKANRKEK